MRYRALQIPETSNWQWRGQQHLYQQFLSFGATIQSPEKLFITTRLGGALKILGFITIISI